MSCDRRIVRLIIRCIRRVVRGMIRRVVFGFCRLLPALQIQSFKGNNRCSFQQRCIICKCQIHCLHSFFRSKGGLCRDPFSAVVFQRAAGRFVHQKTGHKIVLSGCNSPARDMVDRDRTVSGLTDMHPGQLIPCICLDRDLLHCLRSIVDIGVGYDILSAVCAVMIVSCMGAVRPFTGGIILYRSGFRRIFKTDQRHPLCTCRIKCELQTDSAGRGEDLSCHHAFNGPAADLQRLLGLFDIDHAMEGDFFADIVFHSSVGHRIREGDDSFLIREMIAVLIHQFGLKDRFERVFNVSQGKCLSVSVNGKIIRVHLHAPVVFPFDLFDMIGSVGKGPQPLIRLSPHAEPQASRLLLCLGGISIFLCLTVLLRVLCPGVITCVCCVCFLRFLLSALLCGPGRLTVKKSVFIGRKTVLFQFFSVFVIGSDLKGNSRHPFLCISLDLADRKITAHHTVFDRGLLRRRKIYDLPVFRDLKAHRFRALHGIAFGRKCLFYTVASVGQSMVRGRGRPVGFGHQCHRFSPGENLFAVRIDRKRAVIVDLHDGPLQGSSSQGILTACLQVPLADPDSSEDQLVLALDRIGLQGKGCPDCVDLFIGQIALRRLCLFDVIGLPCDDLKNICGAVLLYQECAGAGLLFSCVLFGLIQTVDSALDGKCIGCLALFFFRRYFFDREFCLEDRFNGRNRRIAAAGDRHLMACDVQGKSGRRLCLFQCIGTAFDGQDIGASVFICLQGTCGSAVTVIKCIDGSRKAVRAGGIICIRRGIRRCFLYLHLACVRLIGKLCPHGFRYAFCDLQLVNLCILFEAFRRADLPHIIGFTRDHFDQVGFSVVSGRKHSCRSIPVARIFQIRIETVPGSCKDPPGSSILFDDSGFGIVGGIGDFDGQTAPLFHCIWPERGAVCLVSPRSVQFLQIIGPRITVKDRLVPKAGFSVHSHRDLTDGICHVGIGIYPGFLCACLVSIDAEHYISAVCCLMKAVVCAVSIAHIGIGGYFLQHDAGRLILIDKAEYIGLHPLAVLLGARTDINVHLVEVGQGF